MKSQKNKSVKFKNIKKLFLIIVIISILLFLGIFLFMIREIKISVKSTCIQAKQTYQQDCVESLISLFKDDNRDFGEKNHAIWTLGQLGDNRALPILKETYTGNIPDREPWDEVISQYELKKAINLLDSGFNVTHLFWNPKNFY